MTRKRGRAPNDELRSAAMALWGDGLRACEIARELRLSRQWCSMLLRELGLDPAARRADAEFEARRERGRRVLMESGEWPNEMLFRALKAAGKAPEYARNADGSASRRRLKVGGKIWVAVAGVSRGRYWSIRRPAKPAHRVAIETADGRLWSAPWAKLPRETMFLPPNVPASADGRGASKRGWRWTEVK